MIWLHPNQISAWKKQLIQDNPELFKRGSAKVQKDQYELIDEPISVWAKRNYSCIAEKKLVLSNPDKRMLIETDLNMSD